MSGRSHRRQGYALVLMSAMLWATNGINSTLLFHSGAVGPTDLAALRIYGAAAILSIVVLRARPRLSRRGWLRVTAFGVFGVSVPQWLYYLAIDRIPVPIALIIIFTAPVPVTVFEAIVHERRLPPLAAAAMVVAIVGVIVAVTGGDASASSLPAAGLLFAVATMVAYCAQILLAAAQPPELSPFVRIGVGMLAGTAFWLFAHPLWTLPFDRLGDRVDLGTRLGGSMPAWFAVGMCIVVGTLLPYTLLVAGAGRIGAGASSVTGMVEPIVAAGLAWLLLGQQLSGLQIAGMIVALGGVTATEMLRGGTAGPPAVLAVEGNRMLVPNE